MSPRPLSRRDVLKTLGQGAVAGCVVRAIPLEAAERARAFLDAQESSGHPYRPKFFSPRAYKTLESLCQAIIPAEGSAGGAIEAGAPEFVDLLASENHDFQLLLGGGILWLDARCGDLFGHGYLDCSESERKQVLDSIAFRKNGESDVALSQGVAFFTLLRNLTCDAFFTSKIGIEYLGYVGNTFLAEFPGCPDPETFR
jgi:gluconate 2-dehydrogenase gamma chain